MTLLELLRQELPKRGGWPEGVRYITQDNGFSTYKGVICGYDSLPEFNSRIWLSDKPGRHADAIIMRTDELASDHATAIVTREQYEAAGWDGTGLPPVGCECEIQFLKDTPPAEWFSFKLIGVHEEIVIVTLDGENTWRHISKFSPDKVAFRPLRTEAERAIDEMVRLSGVSIGAAKILYDAGYRKE